MTQYLTNQTERVYAAEASSLAFVEGRRFGSLDEIEPWLLGLTSRAWFHRQFPGFMQFQLHDGRGTDWGQGWLAGDGTSHIRLPRKCRCDLIVLHELTHALGERSHDREFCANYLSLVRFALGRSAANNLRDQFRWANVRHRRFPAWSMQELLLE